MEERVQRKKTAPGAGLDLSGPKSSAKPKRTPEMERALQRSKQESHEFASGVLSLRLEQDSLDQLMHQANSMGLSAGQLARTWIIERLNQSGVTGFTTEQTAQIMILMTEVAQKTIMELNSETEPAQSPWWNKAHDLRRGDLHWTSSGIFQHSCNVFSKKKAEGVINHTLSLLSAVHEAGKPVEVPAPDLEILTTLACSALPGTDSK